MTTNALKRAGAALTKFRKENNGKNPEKIVLSPNFYCEIRLEFEPHDKGALKYIRMCEQPVNLFNIETVVDGNATEDVVMTGNVNKIKNAGLEMEIPSQAVYFDRKLIAPLSIRTLFNKDQKHRMWEILVEYNKLVEELKPIIETNIDEFQDLVTEYKHYTEAHHEA